LKLECKYVTRTYLLIVKLATGKRANNGTGAYRIQAVVRDALCMVLRVPEAVLSSCVREKMFSS
jgi:hypothetical protein